MKKILFAVLLAVLIPSIVLVVQVRSSSPLEFPHGVHAEMDLACIDCHPANQSEDMRTSLSPDRENCLACHGQEDLEAWGMAEALEAEPMFAGFSHQAHLGPDQDCLLCHGAVLHPEMKAEGKGVLSHAVCFECHDGMEQTSQCEDCHSGLREGRLTAMWRDPSILKPMDHHPGYLHSHQFAARLDGAECRECHQEEDFCSNCHFGENVVEMVHPRDWVFTHPVDARKNLHDCQACHEVGEYCADCHAASGVQPGDHFAMGWKARGHAEAARRDIGLCASCHEAEEYFVCSRCHRDDGVRGNQGHLNIHPISYVDDAGQGHWHDDDMAGCYSCHVNTGTKGMGFCGYCHR